ncbi:hypothetical protein WJX84_003375 [Apatococcus fuscideae]|uniref:Nucleoporin Nup43 n=1 Tax=Apatococcus fuscideae TaxID=2026836 RepID=A0AAW1SNF8_9CHLO
MHDSLSEHKLLAVGCWNEDLQRHCLSVLDLQVWTHAETGAVQQDAWQELACWACQGRPTDVKVVMRNGNEVTVLVASSHGHLSKVVLQIPQHSGATPSDIQVLNEEEFEGSDGDALGCSSRLHNGAITAADISISQHQAVTVGMDGAINLVHLEGWTCQPLRPASSSRSYHAAAWVSQDVVITAGTTGGLESWDVRLGSKPVHRSPASWGMDGLCSDHPAASLDWQIHCLDVRPERQHECAVGSSGGAVSLWDLRFIGQPILCTANPDHGNVREVRVASPSPTAAPSPSIFYCTTGGTLARASWPSKAAADWHNTENTNRQPSVLHRRNDAASWLKGSSSCDVLWQETCGGLASFDMHAGLHQELYCVTDQEGLLHLRL